MLTDCIKYCSTSLPYQVENHRFRKPPYLIPTDKNQWPFHTWAIDCLTHLTPPSPENHSHIVLAVCVFSRWVEIGCVADLKSTTICEWFHQNVTCRYGLPVAVRTDKGREFAGAFSLYLQRMGVIHRMINTTNPRANGMAERYVGVIKAGFRKFISACGGHWYEHVGDVLAGLRFLPSRIGLSPFLLCFKQEPHWITNQVGPPASEIIDEPTQGQLEHLINLQIKWWEVMIDEARHRIKFKDA